MKEGAKSDGGSRRDVSSFSGFLIDFALGGVSGAIAKTCFAPLDRVKMIIQTQDANPRVRSGEVPRYTGIRNTFARVYTEQGLASFWRGNLTNVIRYFPTQAFNFAFKDNIKMLFPVVDPTHEFGRFLLYNLASGSLAGVGSLVIVYPLDYAQTRLAAAVSKEKRDFNGLADCLRKTASGPRGVLGLYNGFGVSMAGIVPFRGVFFGVYDSLRVMNPFRDDHGARGLLSKLLIAQVSAVSAGFAAYPFDTVRRRMQMQSERPRQEWLYKSATDCVSKIFRLEGFRSFYKGAGANALSTAGSALVLVLYDEFQSILNKYEI